MKKIIWWMCYLLICASWFCLGLKINKDKNDDLIRLTFKNGYYKGALSQWNKEGNYSMLRCQFKIDSIYFENTYIKN